MQVNQTCAVGKAKEQNTPNCPILLFPTTQSDPSAHKYLQEPLLGTTLIISRSLTQSYSVSSVTASQVPFPENSNHVIMTTTQTFSDLCSLHVRRHCNVHSAKNAHNEIRLCTYRSGNVSGRHILQRPHNRVTQTQN